jgi:hypothetical protein
MLSIDDELYKICAGRCITRKRIYTPIDLGYKICAGRCITRKRIYTPIDLGLHQA